MDRRLANYSRIVIKIGSASIVDHQSGIRQSWLASLIEDVAALCGQGKEILIVSSGAVALGRLMMMGDKRFEQRGPLSLEESQAAASIGQIALCRAYHEALAGHDLHAAQILLTLGDTEQRRRYLNARDTIRTALSWKAVPIINENDSVATAEIRYGDNDRLAARVASMVNADLLILLSDIDGLYTKPPHSNADAEHIEIVDQITPEIEAMAGSAASSLSRGGMKTKIDAAKIAVAAGTAMLIASAAPKHPLARLEQGARSTWFRPSPITIKERKKWIAGGLDVTGHYQIDAGALVALERGKSLLPVGVTAVEGSFSRGEPVKIVGPNGQVVGVGLTEYDSDDAKNVIGLKSDQISELLGPNVRFALIHRDDMAFDL